MWIPSSTIGPHRNDTNRGALDSGLSGQSQSMACGSVPLRMCGVWQQLSQRNDSPTTFVTEGMSPRPSGGGSAIDPPPRARRHGRRSTSLHATAATILTRTHAKYLRNLEFTGILLCARTACYLTGRRLQKALFCHRTVQMLKMSPIVDEGCVRMVQ